MTEDITQIENRLMYIGQLISQVACAGSAFDKTVLHAALDDLHCTLALMDSTYGDQTVQTIQRITKALNDA